MILWANLIADIPPALALGVDPAVSNIMKRLPRDPKKGIFTVKVICQAHKNNSLDNFPIIVLWN